MPGRKFTQANSSYRYGFNGKELDNSTGEGNLDLGARIYDSRIARFLSSDPKEGEYPWQTTYAYFSNSPLAIIDLNGEGGEDPPKKKSVNVIVATTQKQYDQLKDSRGDTWHVILATSAQEAAKQISEYLEKNNAELQTLAYIHHGNVWGNKGEDKIILGFFAFQKLNNLHDTYSKLNDKPAGGFSDYAKTNASSYSGDQIETFIALKAVFGSIRNGGDFISVACNEGETVGTGAEISRMSGNNINVYTNNNNSSIALLDQAVATVETYKIKKVKYGSMMDRALTGAADFSDKNGWSYYNGKTKLSNPTKQDIVLNSSGKPFSLVNGNLPGKKFDLRMQFFSKAYTAWLRKNVGEPNYIKWMADTKKILGNK
jgi:RHS repeat-associated protein